ncbi:AraC family transcriptional regulator [Nonomuraea mesophila]|uniref:AraC family transcriptional regulator n=1 Tax=Nonomuraea mesophila TaxID=2530382 RepID=A0A4R5EVG4_9ACTN|nr:AraC family transcriptional regulator [Nonomuraea mesophila]TDE38822.1 AraC family transcriptional regulator [Nonomuraea mesophila]
MDVISEVIRTIRAGSANARLIKQSGSRGMRFPAFSGSGFHIALRGSCWLIRSAGEPVRVETGDIVLVPSGAEHGFSHAPCALEDLPVAEPGSQPPGPGPLDFDFLCGAYLLDHGRAPQYLQALPDVITVTPDYDLHPELRSLTDLFGADLSHTRLGTGATRSALVDLTLVHALRQWHEVQGAAGTPMIGDPAIATAIQEIHRDPARPWTVARLSEVAGMSRTVFTRRFTAQMGRPPMKYVTDWRLDYAARLLRETDAPLATIARQIGYATEFAFAGAFRREYGLSPGRYRHSTATARDTSPAHHVRRRIESS